MKKNVLAIDCGTQSIRAMVVNSKGQILAKAREQLIIMEREKAGYAEMDPDVLWNSFCNVCKQAKNINPDAFKKIEAMTITIFRNSFLPMDFEGKPLRPIILWMDQREAHCKDEMKLKARILGKLAGLEYPFEQFRKQCKAHWIQENEPDIWAKTYKYVFVSGYLYYMLTGNFKDAQIAQIGHVPYDFKKKTWDKKGGIKDMLFNIEREKLPELVETGKVLGYITKKAAEETGIKEGLKVLATGPDKACDTIGSGCLDSEVGNISLGTAVTIQTQSKKYLEMTKFIPPYPSVMDDYYNIEVQIFRGYWMLSWFNREFAEKEVMEAKALGVTPESLLNKRLKEVPPGSEGLLLQPYWGPALKRPEAKGAIIGFDDNHTRIHIYRAIIEGINYALLESIERIEKKTKIPMKTLTITGGGAQSDEICQITANMLNRPVLRTQTHETAGIGAAVSAFVGLGVYDSYKQAVEEMVHYTQIFKPEFDEVRIYQKIYTLGYKKIYKKLKPIYKNLKHLDI